MNEWHWRRNRARSSSRLPHDCGPTALLQHEYAPACDGAVCVCLNDITCIRSHGPKLAHYFCFLYVCVSVVVKSIWFGSQVLLCRVLSHIISIILRIKMFWMLELVELHASVLQLYQTGSG
jgi:hypothetical protein